MSVESFVGRFGKTEFTITIDYEVAGETDDVTKFIWVKKTSGDLDPNIFRQFQAWGHSVMQVVAPRINKKIIWPYTVPAGQGIEIYVYLPDGSYCRHQ